MTRYNWMVAATWTVPFVCLILAFYIGFYKLSQYRRIVQKKEGIERQIADIDRQTKSIPATSISHLVATDDSRESYYFLVQLQDMVGKSHVTFKNWSNTATVPLPPLNDKSAAAAGGAAGPPSQVAMNATGGLPQTSSATPNQQGVPAGYSLLNLPLGVRAITTEVTVHGSYSEIRDFLYLLRNARYTSRAINVNNATLGELDPEGRLDAKITLTRFVQPKELASSAAANPAGQPPSDAPQPIPAAAANGSAPAGANH
jgi:hypothetical protein